jgi:hypothetical protein
VTPNAAAVEPLLRLHARASQQVDADVGRQLVLNLARLEVAHLDGHLDRLPFGANQEAW